MSKIRVIYMGTPEFAVGPLKKIYDEGYEVVACFTQPDKKKGRGKTLLPPEVKVMAEELGIPVYQPEKIRTEENVELIKELAPDIIVVAAFGQILPVSILEIPKFGCVNIHASLLPKYRGAAPIEWSIIDGEEYTGVTTMMMEKGLDTGDMLEKVSLKIEADDTGESLRKKLSVAGSELIISTMDKLIKGEIEMEKQNDEESSYASMLTKEMGNIDFSKSNVEIERLIRGLTPWPSAYTKIDGKNVKIMKAECTADSGEAGTIIEVTKKSFKIACGEGSLIIREICPEGKKTMPVAAYLNGNKLSVGMKMER